MEVITATNLKHVRRDGITYLGRSLCQSCGNDCRTAGTQTCMIYQPTLKFRNLTGLDAIGFNTFRSLAWSRALTAGQEVAIIDAKSYRILSRMHVVTIATGEREDMERIHGPNNHLCQGRPFRLEWFQSMRLRNSGRRIYEGMKQVSVIYLEKI